jgi:light-regulated signal transduction histidine kinase (bacteriophytochrome)
MKTLMSKPEEAERLQDLGRASMQIVHDLKNQLNGLKLYATFLRRRIEKSERPSDEQETISKLIGGLDRAAEDLSLIVRYAQPVELKKQPGFEVDKVLQTICTNLNQTTAQIVVSEISDAVQGDFDHFKLSEALKWLSVGAIKLRDNENDGGTINVKVKAPANNSGRAVVEWSGLRRLDRDPFRSFAGSDEIKLALAGKIIQAHGGSAAFIDKKLVVELPLAE